MDFAISATASRSGTAVNSTPDTTCPSLRSSTATAACSTEDASFVGRLNTGAPGRKGRPGATSPFSPDDWATT